MRKFFKGALLSLLVVFAAMQMIRPLRSNPTVDPAHEITTIHPTTPAVSSILERSCKDCHSNRTVWPWYSNVAPASWLVVHDVNEGRDALNLSEWGNYDMEKRQELMGKMCDQAKDREMPLPQYTLFHPRARLNTSDALSLCSWTQQFSAGREEAREEDD
jgi:hypothetical protein